MISVHTPAPPINAYLQVTRFEKPSCVVVFIDDGLLCRGLRRSLFASLRSACRSRGAPAVFVDWFADHGGSSPDYAPDLWRESRSLSLREYR